MLQKQNKQKKHHEKKKKPTSFVRYINLFGKYVSISIIRIKSFSHKSKISSSEHIKKNISLSLSIVRFWCDISKCT